MKYLFLSLPLTIAAFSEGVEAHKVQCDCSSKPLSRLNAIKGEKVNSIYKVAGMTCEGCEHNLTTKLSAIENVQVIQVSSDTGTAELSYPPDKVTINQITTATEEAGFILVGEVMSLKVAGMTCEGCEKNLTEAIQAQQGILSIEEINHKTGIVNLTIESEACKGSIEKTIQEAGFVIIP